MNDKNSVVMWGERGLVTTMLLDLHRVPEPKCWELFLESCIPGWARLPGENIRSVSIIIEPDFSNEGFGHPDALLRFDLESGTSHIVIMEAKRLPYAKCCALPSNRGGAGYNSTLNGQLELNHCLALALSDFQQGQRELQEPEWVLHSPYASERRGKLRCVKNPVVIEEIVRPFSGVSFSAFTHLVITTDTANPFEDPKNEPYWPELYHPEFPFQNCWKQLRDRYVWTSWARVEDFFRTLESNPAFAESLFLPTLEKNRHNFKLGTGLRLPVEESPAPEPGDVADTVEAQSFFAPVFESQRFAGKRGNRGAIMIYAPTINPNTFIHFSWLNDSCAIRDYSKSPNIMPLEDRTKRTEEVLARIEREIVIRKRRPISDTAYWYQTTMELNKTELPHLGKP